MKVTKSPNQTQKNLDPDLNDWVKVEHPKEQVEPRKERKEVTEQLSSPKPWYKRAFDWLRGKPESNTYRSPLRETKQTIEETLTKFPKFNKEEKIIAKETMEKMGRAGQGYTELTKIKEELNNLNKLPPEERKAKLQELKTKQDQIKKEQEQNYRDLKQVEETQKNNKNS